MAEPWDVRTVEILATKDQWKLIEACASAIGAEWPLATTLLLMEGLAAHAQKAGNAQLALTMERQLELLFEAIAHRS